MTIKLYYDNAYQLTFTAKVLKRLIYHGQPAVILDQTYFYPTSGGQPHDTGELNGSEVVDVIALDGESMILHLLASTPIGESTITGTVDWSRRFDHMQQHTGQHILSQAFVQQAQSNTESFHLGQDSSTIDLDNIDLTMPQIMEVEKLANHIIWKNRDVNIRYISVNDLGSLSLRKIPVLKEDTLRLIEIADYDLSACGGTHVARTGEVGIIKITGIERRGELLRVEFRCGQRALNDYAKKNAIILQLMSDFTTGMDQLNDAIERLRKDFKESQKLVKKLTNDLLNSEAATLIENSKKLGSYSIIKATFENRDLGEMRILAKELVKSRGIVVFLGNAGNKSHLIFAASVDVNVDMNAILQRVLIEIGPAKGGGTSKFAQGGGPAVEIEVIDEVLEIASRSVSSSI